MLNSFIKVIPAAYEHHGISINPKMSIKWRSILDSKIYNTKVSSSGNTPSNKISLKNYFILKLYVMLVWMSLKSRCLNVCLVLMSACLNVCLSQCPLVKCLFASMSVCLKFACLNVRLSKVCLYKMSTCLKSVRGVPINMGIQWQFWYRLCI